MHWEEKIGSIKKEVDPTDFSVPFIDGSAILKKIEDKFIVRETSDFRFANGDNRGHTDTEVFKAGAFITPFDKK